MSESALVSFGFLGSQGCIYFFVYPSFQLSDRRVLGPLPAISVQSLEPKVVAKWTRELFERSVDYHDHYVGGCNVVKLNSHNVLTTQVTGQRSADVTVKDDTFPFRWLKNAIGHSTTFRVSDCYYVANHMVYVKTKVARVFDLKRN